MGITNVRPRLSLAALLGLTTFTALGIAAFVFRTRPYVSVLSTTTHLIILISFVAMLLTERRRRPFWTGFVVVSLGYFFLIGSGMPSREFYSVPAVFAEWAAGPEDVYFEWSRYEHIRYDKMDTSPAGMDRIRDATRGRIRYIVNCMTAIYLGVIGGYVGQIVAWNASRHSSATT